MNEYLVSVITPAYNCEDTIADTIESVLAQTWTNWEMIIVNDCSTDNTVEIVRRYSCYDERICLISFETNQGSATARNEAIRKCRGKFIALLDADDLWKPQKLEKQIEFMMENDYAFTYTSYDVFSNQNDSVRKIFKVKPTVDYKTYLCNTIIGCLTVVIDKEKILDFHMEQGYLEDVLTWIYYLKKGYIAYGLDINLASYRVLPGSKSNNKLKNAKRFYHCLNLQEDLNKFQRIICFLGYLYNALKKRLCGDKISL